MLSPPISCMFNYLLIHVVCECRTGAKPVPLNCVIQLSFLPLRLFKWKEQSMAGIYNL